jgi:hypothetical protein
VRGVVLPIVVLTAVYGLVITGLVFVFRAVRIPWRWAIALGFSVFGIASGLLAAWAWPLDSCTLPNVYAVLLGDKVYGFSAQRLGDPWLLSVPQVYVVVSTFLGGLAGVLAQWVDARIRARRAG